MIYSIDPIFILTAVMDSSRHDRAVVTRDAPLLCGIGAAGIAAASEQQSTGINLISTAVQQISEITNEVAANAEESASASEELNSQAVEMQNTVGYFRLSHNAAADMEEQTKPNHGFTQHRMNYDGWLKTAEKAERLQMNTSGPAFPEDDPSFLREF